MVYFGRPNFDIQKIPSDAVLEAGKANEKSINFRMFLKEYFPFEVLKFSTHLLAWVNADCLHISYFI